VRKFAKGSNLSISGASAMDATRESLSEKSGRWLDSDLSGFWGHSSHHLEVIHYYFNHRAPGIAGGIVGACGVQMLSGQLY